MFASFHKKESVVRTNARVGGPGSFPPLCHMIDVRIRDINSVTLITAPVVLSGVDLSSQRMLAVVCLGIVGGRFVLIIVEVVLPQTVLN